jgi:DNA-directed RNA polymerase subunit alpha
MTTAAPIDVATLLKDLKFGAADLARARAAIRESRDARSAAEDAVSTKGEGVGALRRGVALFLLGRLREAHEALTQAGDGPEASLVKARVAIEDGDPLGAAEALARLQGTPLDGPEVAGDLATAYALSGNAEGATAAAGRVPASSGADAIYAQAMALEAQGKHAESAAKLEAALATNPNHARALFRLAYASDLQGDDDRAMELYRRCAALEPTFVNALLNLGILLEDHDRFTEAEALYRRVLAGDPQNERARLYLKDVLAAQTQFFDEDSERKEDRRNQILRTPISEFELSVRSRNCLSKMEIKTLGDLITKTETELLAYKNFGETSLQEIKDILAQKGLRLGMGRDETPAATREEAEAELNALFGGASADDEDDDELDDDDGGDPRALSVGALDLSIRAKRAVDALEIETIGDLADRTADELMANKTFGQTTLAEIRKKLGAHGLALKGEKATLAGEGDAGGEPEPMGEEPSDEDDGD